MNMASTAASSRLADIVGASHVVTNPAELAAFEIDGFKPSAVVQPASTEQVAEVVKFAAAEKLALIPTGARTKLAIGLPPRRYDLALDMTRLDRVVAYDPGDLTVSVEAGIPLRALAAALAEHRQFLPLAAPYFNQATIGGTIASGVDGPLRQLYGTARDYLLGMEFVTGEGVTAKSGGRVVKNVTGYDIHKLMIGALGTLGVITRINFKTFPMPAASRAFVAAFENAERACDMRNRVAQSPLAPMTTEILSPRAAAVFAGAAAARIEPHPLPAGVLSNARWAFTAGFAGTDNVLDRYESALRQIAEQCGALEATILREEHVSAALARKREFVPIALASSPAATIMKLSVLPARMAEALVSAAKTAEAAGLQWAAMARGVGVIYFVILPEERNEDSKLRVVRASNQILAACSTLGGHATIPWCPTEWKDELKVWGLARADFAQMQKTKTVFDPGGILCRGRFVGGL